MFYGNQTISDNTRIIKIIPTIKKLLEQKAKIIIISHYGRPKGKWSDNLSLKFLIKDFEALTEKKVGFIDSNVKNLKKIDINEQFKNFDILILENIRFYPEEEKNIDKFSKTIASLGDIFINDCFRVAIELILQYLGSKYLPSFPGKLLEHEVQNLKNLFLVSNESDSIAVIGGSKVSQNLN